MIRGGFLSAEERADLTALARNGLAEHRVARRANAVLLLDKGWNCERVADALFLDDDTVRQWHDLFAAAGVEGLSRFEFGGGSGFLSEAQEAGLKAWIVRTLPHTTRAIGAYVAREFGVVYESRSGLVKLLHRLGAEYQKPEVIGRRLDEAKQRAFIAAYENLLNSLGPDEAVLFVDAVHPTHAARPVGCWTAAQDKLAIEQTSGRQRLNIHGAIDLETGQTSDKLCLRRDDRGRNHRRPIDDPPVGIDRGALSADGADPRVSRQCAIPSRQARARMAGAARPPHQAAFRPRLLPAFEPDRALMGRHAQEHDAQQVLRDLQRIRRRDARLPARRRAQKMARIS